MADKFKQIILHVGMHKTGTTSIQTNCHRHRDFLLQFGIVYPSFRYEGNVRHNHSGPVTAFLCEDPNRYGAQWRSGLGKDSAAIQKAYREQFSNIFDSPQGETLILSGETISAFSLEDLKALRSLLLDHTEKLRVVVYIRSPMSAVGSAVQQRVRAGGDGDIKSIVGVVQRRFERLRSAFGEDLDVINFHEAINKPEGLVGGFMHYCGLPEGQEQEVEFAASNERISMEAYKIMMAINRKHPRIAGNATERTREFNDLNPLYSLPGQPFQLEALEASEHFPGIVAEVSWLEQQLDFSFPPPKQIEKAPLWEASVLMVLEDKIRQLADASHRTTAAEFLQEEALALEATDPNTSAIIAFIASKIHALENDPVPAILDRLGADYFKNGALQVEQYSPELALDLMSLAKHLRPDGKTINSSIDGYRKKLGLAED